jgi:hypothetical protein
MTINKENLTGLATAASQTTAQTSLTAIQGATGTTADAAVTSDSNGTLPAFLRGLVKILASVWDSTNSRLHVGVTADPPTSANILCGVASANGTIITIPANRVWAGWVSINATLMVAASGASVSSRAGVSTAGATVTPAAGVLLGVFVSAPTQLSTTTAQVTNSDRTYAVIAAGTSAATLVLAVNSASAASASAVGVLIA